MMRWVVVLLLVTTAYAKNWSGPRTVYADWYSSQYNSHGQFCCNKADAHDFYGAYKNDADGSVEFDEDGRHYKIPAFMVLSGPNPTGHAVWWYNFDSQGYPNTYCFALGPGL